MVGKESGHFELIKQTINCLMRPKKRKNAAKIKTITFKIPQTDITFFTAASQKFAVNKNHTRDTERRQMQKMSAEKTFPGCCDDREIGSNETRRGNESERLVRLSRDWMITLAASPNLEMTASDRKQLER